MAILLSWCLSPVWAAKAKLCGSRGLRTTDIYSSQFWWLEFKIKVPQVRCLIRPHASFLYPHLWGLLYKGANSTLGASPAGSVVKYSPANAGEAGGSGSIPGWGGSLVGGHGTPL